MNADVPRASYQATRLWGRAISLTWFVGAMGSMALAGWHLPYALAVSSGWLYGVIAVLVVQGAVSEVWSRWWRQIPTPFLIGTVVALLAAHAVVASIAWPPLGHALWMLWIGPVPIMVSAAFHIAAVSIIGGPHR